MDPTELTAADHWAFPPEGLLAHDIQSFLLPAGPHVGPRLLTHEVR